MSGSNITFPQNQKLANKQYVESTKQKDYSRIGINLKDFLTTVIDKELRLTIPYFRPNTIYCGDCKEVLSKFPNDSVDLIYADPPFFSNRHYEVIWRDGAEIRSFGDRWKGGIENYVLWMKERLEHCYRVLKKTGSMYLHCDWHASHHLKVARCLVPKMVKNGYKSVFANLSP